MVISSKISMIGVFPMSNQHYSPQLSINRTQTKLVNVGSAKYSGDWHSVPHTHSYAELFYVMGGTGHIQVDQELYPISTGQLVILNPNIVHTEVSRNASPLEYLVLGIEGLELTAPAGEESRFKILSNQDLESITSCMTSILWESRQELPGADKICQAYTEILVTRLNRRPDVAVSDPSPASANNQCVAVRRYIDAHFKEPLTLDMLAGIAHINKYYLAHCFKEEFGISPINYQLERRIEEGCYLLRQTDLSLAQISGILGFSSSSYFSQIFRKSKGASPSDFRRTAAMEAANDASRAGRRKK